MKEILVDEIGYKQFNDELENLQKQLNSSVVNGSEACKDAIGDGWHDNFAFEESVREGRVLSSKIDKMIKDKKLLKIVDNIYCD